MANRRKIHVIRPKPILASLAVIKLQRLTHAGTRGAALRAADTVVPADRVFSAAEAKGGSAIDASKTALLLVEYQ